MNGKSWIVIESFCVGGSHVIARLIWIATETEIENESVIDGGVVTENVTVSGT